MEIQHFSHKHPLTLEIVTPGDAGNSVSCSACRKRCNDAIYTCKVCGKYRLHKSCAELPERIIQHPFHPQHPLPITFNNGKYACCGCGKWDKALLYYCRDCNFTLSPDCALRPTMKYEFLGEGQIKHFLHDHPLSITAMRPMDMAGNDGSLCLACNKPCSSDVSYYCLQCPNFKLHRSCIEELPRTIRHRVHPQHPMMLRAKDSYFDRECRACQRTDNVLTYRCSMCQVEMDLECALAP